MSQLAISSQEAQSRFPSFWDKLKIYKFKILGVVLGVLVFAGAVFGGYELGQREFQLGPQSTPTPAVTLLPTSTPEPIVTETLQPSPIPVTIEKILYKPNPSWQTYADSQGKFSVQYPQNYKINSSTPGESVSFLSCVNDLQKGEICLSGFMVDVSYDYDGGSRRAWFYKKIPEFQNFLTDPYFQDVIVVGSKALVVMDRNRGGSTGSWVLIPRENMMYLFSFPFGGGPDIKPGFEFIKQVLSTFKFLD